MRIRIAVMVEAEAPAYRLRSPSTLGGIARAGTEQALAKVGLQPISAAVDFELLDDLVADVCAHCGGPIPAPTRTAGRRRRFCSDAHRVAAQRRRAQGLPEQLTRPDGARGQRSLARAVELAQRAPDAGA